MKTYEKVIEILKNTVFFKWNPGKELITLCASYIAVFGFLASATFIATPSRGGLYFLLYGVGAAAIAGIGIPVIWTTLIRKKSIQELGITFKNWKTSLVLQAIFVIPQLSKVISSINSSTPETVLPLAALALAIGFFEAVFWRGWILQALERAFGIIPAIIVGAALYSVYHMGYGMNMSEMAFLFFIGVIFAVSFLLTRNVLILWPVFQPSGQLITVIDDGLALPFIAIVGFIEVFVLMVVILVFFERRRRKSLAKEEAAQTLRAGRLPA